MSALGFVHITIFTHLCCFLARLLFTLLSVGVSPFFTHLFTAANEKKNRDRNASCLLSFHHRTDFSVCARRGRFNGVFSLVFIETFRFLFLINEKYLLRILLIGAVLGRLNRSTPAGRLGQLPRGRRTADERLQSVDEAAAVTLCSLCGIKIQYRSEVCSCSNAGISRLRAAGR